MKYIITIVNLLISSFLFGQGQTKRALFLGNSYTYVNNLPQLIADVAVSMGDILIYGSHTIGGYTLEQHFADSNSTNKIKAGGWDYVILQDQSEAPALEDYSGAGASYLCSLIEEYAPCARAMFYMTWGRKNGDTLYCPTWPPVCTYAGMDSLLHLRYMEMASINHAEVSPVGAVWKYIRQNYPSINLYEPDESHPSVSGTYVAACCFYTSLFKKDPTLISYNYVLSSTDATIIKNAAKHIVFDSLSNWFFENDLPTADFKYTIGPGINEVDFANESMNAEKYLWNFGDGYTSTDKNPIHHYLSDGAYIVKLTASSCDLSQTHQASYQMTINFCSFSPTIFPDSTLICPNSNDTLWTQVYDTYQWFDTNGDPIPNQTNQYFLPAADGYFSVLATRNGCPEMSTQVIVNTYHSMQSFRVDIIGNLIQPDSACIGDTLKLILTTNKPPYPNDNNLHWFKDGSLIPFSNNDTLIVTTSGSYQLFLNDSLYCPGNSIYSSPPIPLTFINCNLPVPDNNNPLEVLVYPNPSENFIIKINPELVGINYTIIDMVGRILRKGKFENEVINLKMSDINSGVYILKVEQKNVRAIKLIRK